jgi:hypothetical protein
VVRLEQHAAECPSCAETLRQFREVAAALGSAVPQVDPPPALRTRVLLAARRARPESVVQSSRWRWPRPRVSAAWGIAAASLVVSVLSLTWVSMLQGQMAQLRADAAAERARAGRYDQVVEVLASPQLAVRTLSPSGQDLHGWGTVYLDPTSRTGMLTARGMPPVQPGHVWQLWFVRGNERLSGGLLWPDHYGNGYCLLQVPADLQTFEGIGVTEEPGQGSAWPTSPRVLGVRLDTSSQ